MCSSYVKTIMSYSGSKFSFIQSSLALWNGMAIPSMLYGTEVLHVDEATLNFIDLQQRKLGKVLLGVPMSSANEGVETELGLRPISERIAERKLKFVAKLESADPGSKLTREVFSCVKNLGVSQLLKDCEILRKRFPVGADIKGDMRRLGRERLHQGIVAKRSLLGVSTPSLTHLWKPLNYLIHDEHFSTIAKFRLQNTGRGNRDASRAMLAVTDELGMVKVCQLCHNGMNDEVHMLIDCVELASFRQSNFLGGESLEEVLHSFEGSSFVKFRRLMDIAAKRGDHTKKQVALGKLLKNVLVEADELWFAKVADHMDL